MSWRVLGASVAGARHQIGNTPCQDACCWRTFGTNNEWLVLAVADGAGDSAHAQLGSTLVCHELVRRIDTCLCDLLCVPARLFSLFAQVHEALLHQAEQNRIRPRDLACTALLALVGPEFAALAQLGDGAIVYGLGGNYEVAFWPEPDEYANAADVLTDATFQERLRVKLVPETIREIAIFTDGLQRLTLDFSARTAYPAFFRPLFAKLRTTTHPEDLITPFQLFLNSPRVNQRTDDDKTLIVAVY